MVLLFYRDFIETLEHSYSIKRYSASFIFSDILSETWYWHTTRIVKFIALLLIAFLF